MSNRKKGGRYTPRAKLGGEWVPVGTPGSVEVESPLVRREVRKAEALSVLALLVDDRSELERQIGLAVEQVQAYGATQAEIGAALGLSQSAVSKRYGSPTSVTIGNERGVDNGNGR
jgi:DNA-directed RNA polymerase specialized sigma24 family protein